jgi:phospholipid-translocating ATPase
MRFAESAARLQFFRPVLDRYARKGLRTLCYAYKPLDAAEYKRWAESLAAANRVVSENNSAEKVDDSKTQSVSEGAGAGLSARERAVYACYAAIEGSGLQLLAVTGIEDRLQPQVADTLTALRRAQVRVWMLTGDKYQTAVEISRACGLLSARDKALSIVGPSAEQVSAQLQAAQYQAAEAGGGGDSYAVLVDGVSLSVCLDQHSVAFAALCTRAAAVVCCRVTPSQKAAVVSFLTTHQPHCITLAIGDGGNDVAMIQTASIGVGVYGKEGLQAARAADYSIARFHHLQRLVLVHGRYSFNRTCFVAQYCFYKSMFICLIQVWATPPHHTITRQHPHPFPLCAVLPHLIL